MKTKVITATMTLLFLVNILVVAIPVQAESTITFTLSPTGDTSGVQDTVNIEAAFDAAVAAGPGSVVELTAGTFYISRPIVVDDFDGTFRGQGKGVTVVQTTGDEPFPLVSPPHHPWGYMFMFNLHERGATEDDAPTTTISGMTLKPVGEARTWGRTVGGEIVELQNQFTALAIGGRYVYDDSYHGDPDRPDIRYGKGIDSYWDITLENIAVEAETITNPNGGTWSNTHNAIWVQGWITCYDIHTAVDEEDMPTIANDAVTFEYVTGTILWEGCYADNFDFGFGNMYVKDSLIKMVDIEGRNSQRPAVFFAGISNSDVEVSRLKTSDSSGVYFDVWGPEPSTLVVSHSDIRQYVDTSWAGIEIWDRALAKSNIVVSHNKIHGEDSFPWGPIFMVGTQDAVIANNIITGYGPAAMYIGLTWWLPVDSATLIGNNVQGWETRGYPADNPDIPAIAPIWLGPGTSGCFVLGNSKTNVVDDGTSNILVGVNNMGQGEDLGQQIKDAMEHKKEIMRMYP